MPQGYLNKNGLPIQTGTKHSEEAKKKIREARKRQGNNVWIKGKKGIHLSPESEFKKGTIPWNKGKEFKKIQRERHWNWKGGITSQKKTIRESIQYDLWRQAVFSRDNWTCQKCGIRGGILHADHIKAFAFHEDLRFAIDNGRTLCKLCHSQEPTSYNKNHVCCL